MSTNLQNGAWLFAFFILCAVSLSYVWSVSIDPFSTQGIQAHITYAPATAFDPDDNGVETTAGTIDFSLQDSTLNFTPQQSEMCSLWQVVSQDTLQSSGYCMGSQDCCVIAQAITPFNLTYMPQSWDYFALSYQQDGIATSHNAILAQIWSANSSNITQAVYSEWVSSTANFTSGSNLSSNVSVALLSPANNAWLNTSQVNFSFMPSSSLAIANCTVRTNASDSSVVLSPLSGLAQSALLSLSDGQFSWNVTCSDIQGASATSQSSSVQVDTQAPQVNLLSPPLAFSTAQPSVNLSFSLSDNLAAELDCFSLIDSAPSFLGKVKKNQTPYAAQVNMSLGTHSLAVICQDDASNAGQSALSTVTYAVTSGITASLEKNIVNLREPFVLNIASADPAPITLTVQRYDIVNRAILESYHPISAPYRFMFNDTLFEGEYTFSVMQGLTQRNVTGALVNNMSAAIFTAPELAIASQELIINASAAGGTAPYQYYWTFNGTQYNAQQYSRSLESSYQQAILTVRDAYGNNKSFTRSFWVYNKLVLSVTDLASGESITNAKVTFNGVTNFTNNSGKVEFHELDGTYALVIEHENHALFTQTTALDGSQERTIQMASSSADVLAPVISSMLPAEGEQVTSPVTMGAQVTDASGANCSLFISDDASLWNQVQTVEQVGDLRFSRDFGAGIHYARLECRDPAGRTTVSPVRSFNVTTPFAGISEQLSQDVEKDETGLGKEIDDIDAQISFFNRLDKSSRGLAEVLGIFKTLDEAKMLYVEARRNLSELRFAGLSESDLAARRKETLSTLDELQAKIPTSFNVRDSAESIVYATNQDISALADELAASYDSKFSAAQKSAYVKQVQDAQGSLAVTALFGVVEVTYLSGSSKTYGIVSKSITVKDPSTDMQLIESVPKSVASSASQINSNQIFQVVKEDPVVRFPVDSQLTYFVEGVPSIDELQKTKTVLVLEPKVAASKRSSQATGLAILPLGSVFDLEGQGKFWLMLVVGILLVFYLFYSLNLAEYVLPSSRKRSQISQQVRELLAAAQQALESRSPDVAGERYTELTMLFESLPEAEQQRHYEQLSTLAMQINLGFAQQMLERIERAIYQGDFAQAHELYPQLNEAYEKLEGESKVSVASRCMAVYQRLSAQ